MSGEPKPSQDRHQPLQTLAKFLPSKQPVVGSNPTGGVSHTTVHRETQTRRPNFGAISGSPSDALQALDAGAAGKGQSGAMGSAAPSCLGGSEQLRAKPHGAGLPAERLMARSNWNQASSYRT